VPISLVKTKRQMPSGASPASLLKEPVGGEEKTLIDVTPHWGFLTAPVGRF